MCLGSEDKPEGLVGRPGCRLISMRFAVTALSYAALRKECLEAVRHWPGCESIGGVQIIRHNNQGFSVRVTLYGNANRRLADRAMRAVEREKRRYFRLTE